MINGGILLVMKQIRKMIVGIAIMLLGISFAIHGGFVENTALLVTGGVLSVAGLLVVLFNYYFNKHDDRDQ